MNKIVIGISLVVGLYLVSFATAENVDVPVQVHDSVPHHQAPLHVAPHGDHTGVPSDAHRTDVPLDVPLDVPTGAPLLDVPADAPQAERDKMKDYLEHTSPRAPMTGNFDCGTPAS